MGIQHKPYASNQPDYFITSKSPCARKQKHLGLGYLSPRDYEHPCLTNCPFYWVKSTHLLVAE